MSARESSTTVERQIDAGGKGTRQAARGSLANLVGAGYAGVASFVVTALVARIASQEEAGLYFVAVSILLIASSLTQVGVPVGYVYFLARLRGTGRATHIRPVLAVGALPVAALIVVVVVLGIVLRDPLGRLLFGASVDGSAVLVVVIAGALPIAVLADAVLAATRGFGIMRPTVVADKFVNPSVQLLALVALSLVARTDGADLVWTRIAGLVLAAAIGLAWLLALLRSVPSGQGAWRADAATWTSFWRFTGPRAVGQFAQVGIQRIDIVMVALWLGPAEAAVYAAATRFLVFGQLAATAIGSALQPRISAMASRRDFGALQHLYRTSTAWILFATWPLYLTFIVHAETLMRVFGTDYVSGAVVLRVLSAAMLVATACGSVDSVLLMAGKSTLTMINAWIALGVNVGLNVWLIPQIGILGAALAWAAAIVVNNLVPLAQVRLTLALHPFGRMTALATSVPLALFGVLPWVASIVWGIDLAAMIVTGVAVVVYLPLLWRWRRLLGLDHLLRMRRRGASA